MRIVLSRTVKSTYTMMSSNNWQKPLIAEEHHSKPVNMSIRIGVAGAMVGMGKALPPPRSGESERPCCDDWYEKKKQQ